MGQSSWLQSSLPFILWWFLCIYSAMWRKHISISVLPYLLHIILFLSYNYQVSYTKLIKTFRDFSRTFQDLSGKIQVPSVLSKAWMLHIIFLISYQFNSLNISYDEPCWKTCFQWRILLPNTLTHKNFL